MIRKTDYYKKMKSIENKCYVDIILMLEEMGISSLRLDDEDFDEVSVLTYTYCDGGAVKRIVSEIRVEGKRSWRYIAIRKRPSAYGRGRG